MPVNPASTMTSASREGTTSVNQLRLRSGVLKDSGAIQLLMERTALLIVPAYGEDLPRERAFREVDLPINIATKSDVKKAQGKNQLRDPNNPSQSSIIKRVVSARLKTRLGSMSGGARVPLAMSMSSTTLMIEELI